MCPAENEVQTGLLGLYERVFPSWEGTRILDLARISDGWETDVFSFTVEYEKAGERNSKDLILRIYPGDYAPHKSATEFNTMKQLYEVGYKVPRVLLLGSDDVPFGKPFVIMERINGRSLGDVIYQSPDEKKLELANLFCKMFVELHALDWRPFAPSLSRRATVDLPAIVNDLLSRWQGHVYSYRGDGFAPIYDWLRERLPDVRFGRPSLIHWDYHPWNVLLRDDGAAFVIDWTGARVSDFRLDLAWTLVLMSTQGPPEVRGIILGGYEHAAGHRVEQIEFFEVAACLRRLSDIYVSLTAGAEKMSLRPGTEAMMKNAGHIESVYALLRERAGTRIPEVEELVSTLS